MAFFAIKEFQLIIELSALMKLDGLEQWAISRLCPTLLRMIQRIDLDILIS